MTFKNIRDIERERHLREKEKFKEDISNDINDFLKDFKTRRKEVKRMKAKNEGILIKILKLLGIIGLGLLLINFLLVNIWLLRFFIKSLFG